MLTLEEILQKSVPFIAAVHNDHIRHVHVIALVSGRLSTQDFQTLRKQTTRVCLEQRKELDLILQKKQEREKTHGIKQELELSL